MLNRDLLIIRYKQPFVDWVNEADPNPKHRVNLEDANDDSPAYLIHDYACEEFDSWLEANYIVLFENLLNGWYTDPALWPQDRTKMPGTEESGYAEADIMWHTRPAKASSAGASCTGDHGFRYMGFEQMNRYCFHAGNATRPLLYVPELKRGYLPLSCFRVPARSI